MSAMLSRTVVAIPDRSDAPTTAIERGANSRSRSNARREPPAGTAAGAPVVFWDAATATRPPG